MNLIKMFDPNILLGDRLELTIYGMFAEAYLAGKSRREAELYDRVISHFPGEIHEHNSINFAQLVDRIRLNGYDSFYPVYANPQEHTLVNGSHRCSIAIQMGVRSVPFSLRFADDRVDEARFIQMLREDEVEWVLSKREEYIDRCDPLTSLKCRLRLHMHQNLDSFQAPFSSETRTPALRFYQALEHLDLRGKRLTRQRMKTYCIERYVGNSARALEIGCNVGFLSLELSQYVSRVDAFDVDRNYIQVAVQVARFLGIKNCRFFVGSINEFCVESVYDLVVSTAIHGWSGLQFRTYVELLWQYLKPGGILLFESHEIDAEKDWPAKKALLCGRFELVDAGFIDDVDTDMYQSEIREFLVLRKPSDDH